MNQENFLENEKTYSLNNLIKFLAQELNNGFVFSLNNLPEEEYKGLCLHIANTYSNKELVLSNLLENLEKAKRQAWLLHAQHVVQNETLN